MELETREAEDRSTREKRLLHYRKELTELIEKGKEEKDE